MALDNMKYSHPTICEILFKLHNLSFSNHVIFCWLPSHVGISGNEKADFAAKSALSLPVDHQFISYHDFYMYILKHILSIWQSKWDGEINNKLHAIKPKLGEWALAYRKSRKEESILCRLRVGHTYLTHSFLLRNEAQPVCGRCQLPLTVRHVLVDCAALTSALNLLRILSNTNWGADRKVMLRFYRSLIRSKLDYGSVVYGSARKSYLRVLDPIHNQGLRLSLGAFRTTPAESLYVEAHEPSLYLRREKLSLQYACRLRANPENPCYDVTFHPNHRETFARRQNSIPTFGLRVLPLFEQIGLPLGNIASHVGISGNEKADFAAKSALSLPSKWDGEINNKLHAIKPKLGEWALAYRKSRKEESILCRLRVGHTYLTHSFLLRNEAQPVCGRCQQPLTISPKNLVELTRGMGLDPNRS
ncbi:hypothetical protein GQR58_022769 [Nymphon striatum]|nr:hypothetical protein GQR58_022769 [Nymphon striatum]